MTRIISLTLVLLLAAAALPIGCASSSGGKSYPETYGLQFMDDESQLEGDYEIFGEIRAEGPRASTRDSLKRQLAPEGMERGADVILVGKLQHEDRKTDYGRERIAFLIGRLVKYK
jgi:hypothetical protein